MHSGPPQAGENDDVREKAMRIVAKRSAAAIFAFLLPFFVSSGSFAFNKEAALEQCRASVGKPTYQACKRGGGDHDTCFAKARAVVQPCIRAKTPSAALFDTAKVSAPKTEDIAAGAAAPGQRQRAAGQAHRVGYHRHSRSAEARSSEDR